MKLKEDIKNALIRIDGFIESSNIIEDIIFWKKIRKFVEKL